MTTSIGVCLGLLACVASAEEVPGKTPEVPKLRALVLVGGHGYDKPTFEAMCRSLPGIDCRIATLPEGYAEFAPEKRKGFDVAVLFDMYQKIGDKQRQHFVGMLEDGKGLVVLHHAIASRQAWPEYFKIIGAQYYIKPRTPEAKKMPPPPKLSTYRHDVDIPVIVKDPKHPITAGIRDFTLFDEVYKHYDVAADIHILLGTDHPENEPTLGWCKTYRNSRVVYLQLGHGPDAYNSSQFRELVARSIRWTARVPDARVATPGLAFDKPEAPKEPKDGPGFEPLLDGKTLAGWQVMGNKAGWEILKRGILRSDAGRGGAWLRYAKREFGDFTLKVQWRVSLGGNSGVFVRAKRQGHPWITGHEIQISNAPRDDAHCTGSLYGSVAVCPRPDESPGRWHEFEIRCNAGRIVVRSDGVRIIDARSAEHEALQRRPLSGFVGLQDAHAPKGNWIEWRNVRIRSD